MGKLFLALLTMAAMGASAEVVVCNGKTLVPGSQPTQTGVVTVDVTAMTATWQADGSASSIAMLTSAKVCNIDIAAESCRKTDLSMSQTPRVQVDCFSNAGATNPSASADLLYSENSKNGRVTCQSVTATEQTLSIEFNTCQVQ